MSPRSNRSNRRRRAYAPTSNTASHDNHEKINSWVSFSFPYMGCLWSSALRPLGPPELRYNCLGLTDEDNSVSRTDNFVNVNVFNTVTTARVLSYRWVLHYFSTIPVGRIKIVTIYKRSIFQVEWLIATLILCISHCSESDSVSSRVFYSAVSTAPRFLFFFSFVGDQTQTSARPVLGRDFKSRKL